MPLKVIIESPYSGNIEENIEYLLECIHDSYYTRKEACLASHLLYTRLPKSKITDYNYQGHVPDNKTSRHGREHGIDCGFIWNKHADLVAVYTDKGISEGMKQGIKFAKENNIFIEYRKLN